MTVYLVISFDGDEQQTFWDRVAANSADEASERIERLRSYAVIVDVLDHELIRSIADGMFTCSVEDAEQELRALEAESIAD